MSDIDDLKHELRLAKAARDEWMEKWRVAELRVESVWDMAIGAALERVGYHAPRCLDKCFQCWIREELMKMLRRDQGNYMPVKERMKSRALELQEHCRLPKHEREAYISGVDDIVSLVEKMLADRE